MHARRYFAQAEEGSPLLPTQAAAEVDKWIMFDEVRTLRVR